MASALETSASATSSSGAVASAAARASDARRCCAALPPSKQVTSAVRGADRQALRAGACCISDKPIPYVRAAAVTHGSMKDSQ